MPQPTMSKAPDETPADLTMHEASRREKLRKLRELGVDPWGQRFDDHQAIDRLRDRESEIVREPAADGGPAPSEHGPSVRAAGRIVLERQKGKLIFIDIRDWTGQIQLLIGRNQVGEEDWALAECFDLGDLIGVDGELKQTKTGELTHLCRQAPLPDQDARSAAGKVSRPDRSRNAAAACAIST